MTWSTFIEEDVRLIILRALSDEHDFSHNETILSSILETFGHSQPRDYIRNQLRYLEDQARAITTREAGSVIIATITQAGLDHVAGKGSLVGVRRPSPRS